MLAFRDTQVWLSLNTVVRFACAVYRRSTPYIRIPTTLIGLIDASVSNRVAINWNSLKNRLGAYHEPIHTILDHTFLRTLPEAELRNGMAEILKITSCTDLTAFKLVQQYGLDLIRTRFFLTDEAESASVELGITIIRQSRCILPICE